MSTCPFYTGGSVDIRNPSTILPEIRIILWLFMIPRVHRINFAVFHHDWLNFCSTHRRLSYYILIQRSGETMEKSLHLSGFLIHRENTLRRWLNISFICQEMDDRCDSKKMQYALGMFPVRKDGIRRVLSRKKNLEANGQREKTQRFLPRNRFKKVLVIYPYIEYKISI
jgi:hypothetical protein